MPFRHFYLLSHYICNGLLFLFSVSWLHVNEFNSFGKIKGRDQMSTSCSEGISVRIFYCSAPTLHLLWSILFIFCLLAPEGMNSIVFGRDKGEWSGVYCLLGRYLCLEFLLFCSRIIFAMVYSFYFLLVGSRRNEFNSLWKG